MKSKHKEYKQFRCSCGALHGAPVAGVVGFFAYPNPAICGSCGKDNNTALRDFILSGNR